MDDAPRTPLSTREFAARWTAILEEHFAGKLAESLSKLAATPPDASPLTPGQSAALARHVARALHVAASSAGGVQDGVQYLAQVAAEGEGANGIRSASS
jgi:hypothetical protein